MLRSSRSWLSRNSSVSLTNAVRRLSSNHGYLPARVRRQQPDVAHLQPLAEEVLHERRARARIGEHAPHLRIEHLRVAAASRESPGRAARRPGCCSTGRTTGATPARHPGRDRPRPASTPAGSASMRNRKSGLTSSRSSADRMPVSKSAVRRARPCRTRAASARPLSSRAGGTRAAPGSRESSSRTAFLRGRSSGEHTKMRRRLSESCGTWPLYGPPISSTEKTSGARMSPS